MKNLTGAGLLLLILSTIAGGCAGNVRTVHHSADFYRADLTAGRLAVGGCVLSSVLAGDARRQVPDGLPAGDVLAQADAWSPVLYGHLLAAGPDVPVWPWAAVRGACPDSLLEDVLRALARGSVLRPAQLTPLHQGLEGVAYLAVARITGDETTLHEGVGAAVDNQRVRDGRDLHGSPGDAGLKTRRKVTVTLEVYDLAAGRVVWTTTADRHRDALYDFAAAGAQGRPPVVARGEPVITAGGKPLPAVDFTDVLGDVCAALARRLLAPAGGDS